jgi:hypothetical protein
VINCLETFPERRNERISFSFSKIRHGRAPVKKTGKLPVNHGMLSYFKCLNFVFTVIIVKLKISH